MASRKDIFQGALKKARRKMGLSGKEFERQFCPPRGRKIAIDGVWWIVVYSRTNPVRISLEPFSTVEYEEKLEEENGKKAEKG